MMKWTKEQPTEPGWYWTADQPGQQAIIVLLSRATSLIEIIGDTQLHNLDEFTYWSPLITAPRCEIDGEEPRKEQE